MKFSGSMSHRTRNLRMPLDLYDQHCAFFELLNSRHTKTMNLLLTSGF